VVTKLDQVSKMCSILCRCFFCNTVTVLLRNHNNHDHPSKAKPNFVVDSLPDIISLLQSPFTIEIEE